MGEAVIKLGRKLRGIKDHNIYHQKVFDKDVKYKALDKSPEQIIDDARKIKRLEDRIKILEDELQRARDESFRAGYDEGKQRTMQDALNRIEAVRHEMKQQEAHFRETLENLEKPLLRLARAMAAEVIQQELQSDEKQDAALRERLRLMLEQVIDQNNVWIKVNPSQLNAIHPEEMREQGYVNPEARVHVSGDDRLKPGEAHVDTEDYQIDGSFENHLDKLEADVTRGNTE
ncbi:MAG: hypothetical protein D6677_06855 [Calditrichaeota bacterium]|nr:MAG: hypothetical protein D6677_06855 [Calditrichota bacterium]